MSEYLPPFQMTDNIMNLLAETSEQIGRIKFLSHGNGRMGRLWHSLLLGNWNEIFFWLPIGELIRSRQEEYYQALGKSDELGESSPFVEFMLGVILDTLKETK